MEWMPAPMDASNSYYLIAIRRTGFYSNRAFFEGVGATPLAHPFRNPDPQSRNSYVSH